MAVKQLISGRLPTGTTAGTNYHSISAGYTGVAEARSQTNWRVAGAFRKLRVELSALLDSSTTASFTLRINGADTALTVSFDDATLTQVFDTADVAVAVGDLVCMQTTNGGTGGGTPTWSLEFQSTADDQSVYSGGGVNGSGTTPLYLSILSDGTDATAENNMAHVLVAGTVTSHGVCLHEAPNAGIGGGAGEATFTLYVSTDNGATWTAQDGSGGTPDTRVVLTASRTGATTFSLSVSDGDLLISRYDRTGGNAINVYGTRSISWNPSTASQWMYAGRANTATINSATRYIPAASQGGFGGTIDDGSRSSLAGVTSHSVGNLRVWLSAAPGASKSYTYDYLLNESTTPPSNAPTVTITGAATQTGTDGSNSLAIVDTDLVTMRVVPAGTPASARTSWVATVTTSGGTLIYPRNIVSCSWS